jgi:hypothetical protein
MAEGLAPLLPILSLISGVIILRVVGFVTGRITFETWSAAFGAVVIAYFVGWGAMYLVASVWPQMEPMGPGRFVAVHAAFQVVLNFVSLGIASSLLSGIRVKGVGGLLMASVVLTAINMAMMYLPFLLAVG